MWTRLRLGPARSPVLLGASIPIVVLAVTLGLTSMLIVLGGANPLQGFYYFLIAPLASRTGILEVLVKATPLMLTGVAVAFAFAAGYWNIGAEGQLYAGAVAAAWLGVALKGVPATLAVPAMLVGGFVAGLLWALPPAVLKVKLAVDEVVTTLLLNSVMLFIVSFLLNGPWRDPESGWPQSPEISAAAVFPQLVPRSRLHLGFLVALIMIGLVWFVLRRTGIGLQLRAAGLGREAARYNGVPVDRSIMTAALVSGGMAGIAGVSEVAGLHFHLIEAISPGYGYTGIVVATLGALNPIAVGAAGIFIGLIETGSQTVSRALGVPAYLGDVVQATLLLVTLAALLVRRFIIVRAPEAGIPAFLEQAGD